MVARLEMIGPPANKLQVTSKVTLLATDGNTSFLPVSGMVSPTIPPPRGISSGVDSVLPDRWQRLRRLNGITSGPALAMYEYSIVVPLCIVLFISLL